MKKSTLALAFAVVLAVLAVVAVRQYIEGQKDEIKEKLRTQKILIAHEPIMAGEPVKSSQLEEFEIPFDCLLEEMVLASDAKNLVGKKSVKDILRGKMLLLSYFREPLPTHTVSIPAGMRIATLGVNQISGIAGLISPGDNVDVIWTRRGGGAPGGGSTEATITLFHQVLVYAIDEITLVGYRPERRIRADQRGATPYSTVTLLLFPLECELMVYAVSQGEITLVKRSPTDASAPRTAGVDQSQVDTLLEQAKKARQEGSYK